MYKTGKLRKRITAVIILLRLIMILALTTEPTLLGMPEAEVHELLIALVVPLAVAACSGVFSAKNVLWFMSLLQSKFCPDRRTFRTMWTISHILMGISSFLIWREVRNIYAVPIILYVIQLFFNSLFCPLFFGAKRLDISLIDLVILDIVLGICIFNFFQISILAGVLMLPYYGWVLFNTALNADFYRLQEGQKKDPVFFTTNYSPHHMYEASLAKQTPQANNGFYTKVPDAPKVLSTPPPLANTQKNSDKSGPLRYRFGETPESLYVQ